MDVHFNCVSESRPHAIDVELNTRRHSSNYSCRFGSGVHSLDYLSGSTRAEADAFNAPSRSWTSTSIAASVASAAPAVRGYSAISSSSPSATRTDVFHSIEAKAPDLLHSSAARSIDSYRHKYEGTQATSMGHTAEAATTTSITSIREELRRFELERHNDRYFGRHDLTEPTVGGLAARDEARSREAHRNEELVSCLQKELDEMKERLKLAEGRASALQSQERGALERAEKAEEMLRTLRAQLDDAKAASNKAMVDAQHDQGAVRHSLQDLMKSIQGPERSSALPSSGNVIAWVETIDAAWQRRLQEEQLRAEEEMEKLEQQVAVSQQAASLHAARQVASLGAKLWRVLKAQQTMSASAATRHDCCGSSPAPPPSGRKPLYALPPSRKASGDAASDLLTEMSQALRTFEEASGLLSRRTGESVMRSPKS
eukprot:TRINITY_DN29350_c0_g1_i1.p1 TRINITY_DN29350_c0_g1~~TRINITY_DN29350_c0_g1_i1.p1  ORF type:complete len:429 (+),score=84.26 TRINITY_DN29350_c0_g1_i1:96-1382(+)